MKINTYTRAILNLIIAIVFCSRLIHSVTANERIGRRKDSDKHSAGDFWTMKQGPSDQKRHRSASGRRQIPGQARAMNPPAEDYLHRVPHLPDVSATCSRTGLVLRVKRIFFGFSAEPEELTLGNTCKSNGVLEPHNDLLFVYSLTDCQSEQQVFPEYISYKYVLHYVPLSNRQNFRVHRVNVGVECQIKRYHVHSQFIRPTYTPLRKSIRSRLGDFRIQLMDDTWSSPIRSAVYLLGQRVNVQVSTQHEYPSVKLFINRCYVTTTQNSHLATKHTIIDNFGCLQESKINPDARFRFTKEDNIVQFSFGAFQFVEAPDSQVSLHCELSVSGGDPSPVQKSCFFNHIKNKWISVFGQDSVCDCCDSACHQTKSKRLIYEGFVSSDQVVFTDEKEKLRKEKTFTSTASTLDSVLLTPDTDDAIWFQAKLTKVPQKSHNHKDFVASVSLRSSEDHSKKQNKSHTNRVQLGEETMKVIEVETQDDEEILMATSESFVRSERPFKKTKETRQELHSMESVSSLGWSKHRTRQNLLKGQSYWSKEAFGNDMRSMRILTQVNETMEGSAMDDWTTFFG